MPDESVHILSPVIATHHAVRAGVKLYVAGEAGDGVQNIWLKVIRNTEVPPAAPTVAQLQADGWVSTPRQANGQFSTMTVAGTVTFPLVGDADNQVVAIPQLLDGSLGVLVDNVPFTGRPQTEHLAVDARSCMWFAFAPFGQTGPCPKDSDKEPDVGNYRPPMVIVPINAASVGLTATGTWRHYPPDPTTGVDIAASGPDGRLNEAAVPLQEPGYKKAAYGSDQMADGTFHFNALLGLLVDANRTPPFTPFLVGAGPTSKPVLDLAELYLACHDDRRWHNNSWAVNVTLTWETIQVGFLRLHQRSQLLRKKSASRP